MTTLEIIGTSGGVLIAALTLVQIAPIKIDPWTAIARRIGKAINGEILEEVNVLKSEVSEIKSTQAEQRAIDCRARILRFGDEVLHREKHTKEHFDQILRDIDTYDKYCQSHPNFENRVTEITSSRIMKIYEDCCRNGDFL